MPKGTWAFLHEWVLYDYLNSRHEEKTLRFKMKVKNGQLILKDKWIKVLDLKPINKTQFPDVESIFLTDLKTSIPAEIKFTTSLFEYHRKAEAAYCFVKTWILPKISDSF